MLEDTYWASRTTLSSRGRGIPYRCGRAGRPAVAIPSREGDTEAVTMVFRGYTGLSPAAWRREQLAALGTSDALTAISNGAACIRHWRRGRALR